MRKKKNKVHHKEREGGKKRGREGGREEDPYNSDIPKSSIYTSCSEWELQNYINTINQ